MSSDAKPIRMDERIDPREVVLLRRRWELPRTGWVRVLSVYGDEITYQPLPDGSVTQGSFAEFLLAARDGEGRDAWGQYRAPWVPEVAKIGPS